MSEYVDLRGAGAVPFRFRRAHDLAKLPATGGNFVYVRHGGETPMIVGLGSANNLQKAAQKWAVACDKHQADALYVRLNVSRQVREAEHAELAGLYDPPMVLTDADLAN